MNSNLNIMDLSNILHSLGSSQRTGTLKLEGPNGLSTLLYIRKGLVSHIHVDGIADIVGTALLKSNRVDEESLSKARVASKADDRGVAEHLVEAGWVSPEEVVDSLARQATEEVCEVFTWRDLTCEFYDGEPLPRTFTREELSYPFEIQPDLLVIESARRQDEWASIARVVPSAKDVYAATPRSFQYMQAGEEHAAEREILFWVDGVRDVDEILEKARLSRFAALKVVASLVEGGELQPIQPLQLVQLAFDLAKEGNVKKCLRLYERADELGVDQWDLSSRIARAYETLGDTSRASRKYLDFAHRCLTQQRYDEAIMTLQKIMALTPNDFDTHERLINLLVEQGRKEEASREIHKLISKVEEGGETTRLIRVWQKVLLVEPGNLEAYGNLAGLYQTAGMTAQAIVEFDGLASRMIHENRLDDAISIYRQIVEIDPSCRDARMSLATALAQVGRSTEAVRELTRLAEILSSEGAPNRQALMDVHEKIADLEPDNKASREWLANAYAETAQVDKAVGHFRGISRSLQRAGRLREALGPLQRIVDLVPSDAQARKDLARAYAEIGESATAARILHTLADENVENLQATMEIYEEILRISPFDLKTHKSLAEMYLQKGEMEKAVAKLGLIARMCNHVGLYDEADAILVKIAEHAAHDPQILREMAETLAARHRNLEAARHLVRYARSEMERKNLGHARWACDRIAEIDPDNSEIEEMRKQLEAKDSMLAGQLVMQPSALSEGTTWSSSYAAQAIPVTPDTRPAGAKAVKTVQSVAGIAAKIRSLHRPKEEAPPDAEKTKPSETTTKGKEVLSPAAKLKAMKKEKEAEPRGPSTTTAAGAASGAARLKAMKAGSPPPVPVEGDDCPPTEKFQAITPEDLEKDPSS